MENVASWPFEKRLEDVFWRSLPKVGPDAAEQLRAAISPQSLAIMAGVILAWIVSHAFGAGQIIDAVLFASGILCVGMAVFSGINELYGFADRTYNARTPADLDDDADHLAKAIAIIGIAGVMAWLLRRAPNTYLAPRPRIEALPYTGGWRYAPEIIPDASLAPGRGITALWGDIKVSIQGSTKDQALALAHELGHRLFAPRLYLLRRFRIESRHKSMAYSSLWRYLEEAFCETKAQVSVNGFLQFITGITFPVKGGYVYLLRGGAAKNLTSADLMAGHGLLPEAAALLMHGLIAGVQFDLWFSPQPPPAQAPPPPAMVEPRPSAGRRW
ncbi:hypothetical protein FHP25_07330 [Vineibacter terrae]|uniref:Uncharacterized protein n=1 Tax=Vineibacter terrae TaxID=2586908 RepID=A0A5C8PRF1_9HYPH|nr:hypothetical protein [Vineibacter terrae]TXL78798.1 hypothetical protein FHP25_07330 [Vineibacter terrae]